MSSWLAGVSFVLLLLAVCSVLKCSPSMAMDRAVGPSRKSLGLFQTKKFGKGQHPCRKLNTWMLCDVVFHTTVSPFKK
jgi:hypothetical protein